MSEGRPWRDKETIKRLYIDEDLTSREIAERFGCDKTTVLNWVEKHEIEKRDAHARAVEPWDSIDELVELYVEEERSTTELAERYDVHQVTICKHLKKADVEMRSFTARKDVNFRDEGVLHDLYWDEELTIDEVADRRRARTQASSGIGGSGAR